MDRDLASFYRAHAPHYDAAYEGLEDTGFYGRLAAECGGPVLELGCGTGRVLLPIARDGIAVYGMDGSEAMLERLFAKLEDETPEVRSRVTVVRGDIRRTSAGVQVPLVFSAGNVLHSFLEHEEQRAYLRNARRHLAPGGAFCFDVFQFDYKRLLLPPGDWLQEPEHMDPATGHRTRRYYRTEHEPEFQRFRVDMRWVVEDAEGKVVSDTNASVMQRWFTRGELELLLEMEGFRITDHWGEFNRGPFGAGSPQQIIRAVAA
jgi:SAM-dependent methyltransferase